MQANAEAHIPNELTTPLQTLVVVLRELLLDELEVVVVVDVVVVVRVVTKLVVLFVVTNTGTTFCVAAHDTMPARLEHDVVAKDVDAGKTLPPWTKLSGHVSTPPSPVVQDVMVVVLWTVVTGRTTVVGEEPAPLLPRPGSVMLSPPEAPALAPPPKVAVPEMPMPPEPVAIPTPAETPADNDSVRPASRVAPISVELDTATPTPPLAPMKPSPVAVAMIHAFSGSPPLAQMEGLLVVTAVMDLTSAALTDIDIEGDIEGWIDGRVVVRAPAMLVFTERDVVGTLTGRALVKLGVPLAIPVSMLRVDSKVGVEKDGSSSMLLTDKVGVLPPVTGSVG